MKVLISCDHPVSSENAATWIRLLNFPSATEIHLMHVNEIYIGGKVPDFNFDLPISRLSPVYTNILTITRTGNEYNHFQAELSNQSYDLVVLGVRGTGRFILHRRMGLTVSKLMKSISIPFLVVRNVPDKLKKTLMCTGGESTSEYNIKLGARLLSYCGADIGILHVMSQVALSSHSSSRDLLDTAQTAIQRKTREGIHLAYAVEQVRLMGVKGNIQPILRHGLVLDQVNREILEGHYDLLVIGSHHVSDRKKVLEYLLEDIAGKILSEVNCSVLVT
jgi:nucleotide-binding universal stress UspA family protein